MPLSRSTGMPGVDAQHDFLRARRRAAAARLIARLRGEPDDVGVILPYEEVVEALGFVSERALGLQVVALDGILGTVDRGRDFDRRFRPTSGRVRSRWERIATAMRRGEPLPPVDLVRVGEIHFVRDGHHRVSVARALGRADIDAYVTEVITRITADRATHLTDLALKSHERVFFERVPLTEAARAEISLSDPWDYAELAEGVEAWGFRAMQDRVETLNRAETARAWLEQEYRPVVVMLREAELIGDGTDTEAYMRVAAERYRLLRTHQLGRRCPRPGCATNPRPPTLISSRRLSGASAALGLLDDAPEQCADCGPHEHCPELVGHRKAGRGLDPPADGRSRAARGELNRPGVVAHGQSREQLVGEPGGRLEGGHLLPDRRPGQRKASDSADSVGRRVALAFESRGAQRRHRRVSAMVREDLENGVDWGADRGPQREGSHFTDPIQIACAPDDAPPGSPAA